MNLLQHVGLLRKSRHADTGGLILPEPKVTISTGSDGPVLSRRQLGLEMLLRPLQVAAGIAVAGVVLSTPQEAQAGGYYRRRVQTWDRYEYYRFYEWHYDWSYYGGWKMPRGFVYTPGYYQTRAWWDDDLRYHFNYFDGYSSYYYTGPYKIRYHG